MIIDDDIDDIDMFCDAVAVIDPNASCIRVRNGEEALNKLHETDILPNYVFLDLNMPRMNGIECLTKLKIDTILKSIPVVILTTSSAQKDIDQTDKLGAIMFITKPIEYRTLIAKISSAIEKIDKIDS